MSKSEVIAMIGAVAMLENPTRRLWLLGNHMRRTAEEMVEVGEYAGRKVKGAARVAYVMDDDATFGLANIHAVYREDDSYAYQLFRDETEAMAWLAGETST